MLGESKLVEFLFGYNIFFFSTDCTEGSALLEISESTDWWWEWLTRVSCKFGNKIGNYACVWSKFPKTFSNAELEDLVLMKSLSLFFLLEDPIFCSAIWSYERLMAPMIIYSCSSYLIWSKTSALSFPVSSVKFLRMPIAAYLSNL